MGAKLPTAAAGQDVACKPTHAGGEGGDISTQETLTPLSAFAVAKASTPPPPCACTALSKHRVGVGPPFEGNFGTAVFVVQNGGLGVCRAFVQGKRGSVMSVMVHSVHNNIVLHIGTPCCLF